MTENNDNPLTPNWDASDSVPDPVKPDDAVVENAAPVGDTDTPDNTPVEEEEKPAAKKATKKTAKKTAKKATESKVESEEEEGFSFSSSNKLEIGASGKAVEEWQEALRSWRPNALPRGGVTGEFDRETYRWTRRFQSSNGISTDGTVGAQSRRVMKKVLNK